MKVWHTSSGYSITCVLGGRSNVFLLSGNGKAILIDTSPGYRWRKLKKRLTNLHIKKIDFLILTHTHFDHAANALKIKREFGATVIVNKNEAGYLENGETINIRGTVFLFRGIVKFLAPFILPKLKYEPCNPDIIIDQNLSLQEFGFNSHILYTPGHSPGSQSIIVDNEIAIVGDAMFGVFPGSVFPPYADDEEELIKSWGKLLQTGCKLFLPSHGTADNSDLVKRVYKNRTKLKI